MSVSPMLYYVSFVSFLFHKVSLQRLLVETSQYSEKPVVDRGLSIAAMQ